MIGSGTAALAPRLLGDLLPRAMAADSSYGPLSATADANGFFLPAGFSSRVVARGGEAVGATGHVWHGAADGGATFATGDGGWIYVSNSEVDSGGGGVGALRVDSAGDIVGAYAIASGTSRNCAGGPTPWGTWLSCEETWNGQVWECDPTGARPAVARPALGSFNHEAAACDPVGEAIYLTEDSSTGRLRRFRPTVWGDLTTGVLEAAFVAVDGTVSWSTSTTGAATFNGGEGAWYGDGKVWFTTKGDNRVWELDVRANPQRIRVLYQPSGTNPVLTGVDNIVGSPSGDLFVAEDGGNMELVLLDTAGVASPFLRLNHTSSELTGPAFDPSGTRLYLSSQRGGTSGVTYEIRGPFRTAPPTTTTTTTTTTTATTTAPPPTTTTVAPASTTTTVKVRGRKPPKSR